MSPRLELLLIRRDLVRLLRQPARIVASVATPILLGLFLASGLSDSLSPQGVPYPTYLLPGLLVMVVLFSSIFSAMALIDDRERGVLQGLLVSPVAWTRLAGARLIGACIVSIAQALVLLAIGQALGIARLSPHALLALPALTLIALGTTGLGLAMAWFVGSKEGFHGVMNLILMPMWLLSGAFFTPHDSAPVLATIMTVNPLTHATEVLRQSVSPEVAASSTNWFVALGYALAGSLLAILGIGRPRSPGKA